SQAFTKAWEWVCGGQNNPILIIPEGKTFLLHPIKFQGPCKSRYVYVRLEGNIVAPSDPSCWDKQSLDHWLAFEGVNGLFVNGNGQIDGQGSNWWSFPAISRPPALQFVYCNHLIVDGLKSINSQRNHISVTECTYASFSHLQLTAPADSTNTDGIDITQTSYLNISDSFIGTGDDCVAINTGSFHIYISGLTCGPGHGISVGSLGKNGEYAEVEDIQVKDCILKGTQNGARIKTWQGGSGYARNITFENITLIDSGNPIIINQYYCPQETCINTPLDVNISDVSYLGVYGTSITEDAINLNCSKSIGCSNILLDNINITPSKNVKGQVYSSCNSAHGTCKSSIPPVACLLD
ncbi:Glyco_hydro_28 domain-containing protein, partial [Cephalotus follicularis]